MAHEIPKLKDFKKGFKYQAWIGFEWADVVFPITGFAKKQLQDAIDKKIVRKKIKI